MCLFFKVCLSIEIIKFNFKQNYKLDNLRIRKRTQGLTIELNKNEQVPENKIEYVYRIPLKIESC